MKAVTDEAIASVVTTLKSGTLHRYKGLHAFENPVTELERRFAEFMGARHALAVNSGSSAMLVALLASGIKAGDEILMPAFTFIAVPSAAVRIGAKPVLVEVTDELVMDCDDLERKITPRTTCLLLSYMRGRVANLDQVVEICKRRNLTLIEDCAYAVGTLWGGIPVGRFGRAGAYAFHTVIDTGEGGMVVTDDDETAHAAMFFAGCYDTHWRSHHGVDDYDDRLSGMVNRIPVYGVRMPTVIAALALPQLGQCEERIAHLDRNYKNLAQSLSVSQHLRVIQHHEKVRPTLFTMQVELLGLDVLQREAFVVNARERGIDLTVFGLDPYNSRCWWRWNFFETTPCPRTQDLLERTIDIGLPIWLGDEHIEMIADVVLASLNKTLGRWD